MEDPTSQLEAHELEDKEDFLDAQYPRYSKLRHNSDENLLPLLQRRQSYPFDGAGHQSIQAIYPRRRRSWMIVLVLAGLAIVLFGVLSHKYGREAASSWNPKALLSSSSNQVEAILAPLSTVCLVGNAETSTGAFSVYKQWGGQFPAVFYIWGVDSHRSIFPPPRNLQYLRAPADLSFAEGMFAAIEAVRARHSCGYIFTHDENLVFHLTAELSVVQPAKLAAKLVELLGTYHPAVAGFPWDLGDSQYHGMTELRAAFTHEPVAPLTGFENGMVIYHHTVVDFFFPFAPRGEGGFVGGWSLGAHFLQMFGPLVFREHAIRLNAIRYQSTMDTPPKDVLATLPAQYHIDDAYLSFLKSGLKDREQRWGHLLNLKDVVKPAPGAATGYSDNFILERLDDFYEIRHEALSNKSLIRRASLPPITTPPTFTIRMIFFTRNRVGSFRRAWSSYWSARPVKSPVLVDIFMDCDENLDQINTERYDKYLGEISANSTKEKPIRIFRSPETKGLRRTVMESWNPTSNHEYAIFVEDDIELSPFFLDYAEAMIQAYVYRDRADYRLHGISLYNLRYNEALEDFVSVHNNYQPYIYQQAQSWGEILLPEPWRQLQLYHQAIVESGIDPVVPNSMTNRWPFKNSWKKPFMRFLVQRGGYFLYPNLPHGLSFSTNHVEPGTNDKPTSEYAKGLIWKKFKVPLLQNTSQISGIPITMSIVPTPPLSSLVIYDMIQQPCSSLDLLPRGEDHVSSFDKCTIIITVYSRITTYVDRMDYYANFSGIGQILILWNNIDVIPPQLVYTNYSIPVEILRMKKNSLNNRFFPWPQIKYSCIMNMDDDWDMPYEHMEFAISVWKGNFFNHLVGYSHQGRNHAVREIDGVPTTMYSPTSLSPQLLSGKTSFYSIVLTSGFIYHRKYLDYYTYQLPQAARDLVDANMNCEDILFNYMVANETKAGPVVIDVWARMLSSLGDGGLWSKAGHTKHRSNCLTAFNELFGRDPLLYTTTMFKTQIVPFIPGLRQHESQQAIPFDYACNSTKYETDGGCWMQIEKEYWDKAGGWVT